MSRKGRSHVFRTIERWAASPFGRVVRVVAGGALIAMALSSRNSWFSFLLFLAFGLLLLVGGLFNLALLMALFGGPLHGEEYLEDDRTRV